MFAENTSMRSRKKMRKTATQHSFPRVDNGPATFTLDSGVEIHEMYPETFYLPPAEERETLQPGDLAKLIFRITGGKRTAVERMWVIVEKAREGSYVSVLDNDPYCTESIRHGLVVTFQPEHVIQIQRKDADWPQKWFAQ